MKLERKDYWQCFERKTRDNGKRFTVKKEDAPDDLCALIQLIHGELFDCLPNDWIYETIWDAFVDLKDEPIDNMSIECDCYHSSLYKWLGNPFAQEYCNEVLEEGLECKDIYHIIGYAQERAKERIYRAVEEFMNEER